MDWLARPAAGGARRPGPAIFDEAITKVTASNGAVVPLVRVAHAVVGALAAPGFYTAERGAGVQSTFAVNVGDLQVSNLARTSLSAAARAGTVSAGASGRAWWLYCAIAAFALVLGEWWTWQRRITV